MTVQNVFKNVQNKVVNSEINIDMLERSVEKLLMWLCNKTGETNGDVLPWDQE